MSNEGSNRFDHGFYKLCKLDNLYIFEFSGNEQARITPMTISQLDHIVFSKMKPGKACDIYQLTVENLRHCGLEAKLLILAFISRILSDIYYLTCPQIKLGVGTAVHKRDIQVRELYSAGERVDILSYSMYTYQNTECHLKLKDKLSRRIKECKGNRKGHVRASGNFKVYINPCLISLNSSKL